VGELKGLDQPLLFQLGKLTFPRERGSAEELRERLLEVPEALSSANVRIGPR
jgi:hypothetical protein